jgi:ABC-type uncharacterized transport system involved in gliding motility auxiliary subunit
MMKLVKTVTTTTTGLLVLVLAVVSLNIIASRLLFRADLTQDKVFSLSDGTRSILQKLDRDVTVKMFFSRSIKELPPLIKTYATRVEEVLQEYSNASGGHITVEVIDPKPDTDDEEWALKYGLNGVRLPKGDQMFFGVVLIAGTQEVVIPYLDPRREEFLEYDLSEALVSTMRKDRAKIGIMSSLPVTGGGPGHQFGGEEGDTWALVNDLKRNFEVENIGTDAKEIPAGVKVLIVLHPKNLSDQTLYAIDQYVLSGGRLIAAVDPMSRTDLQINGQQMRMSGQMPQMASDLNKLFAAWDIEYDPGTMAGDTALATQINAGGVMTAYPFFVSLSEANLAQNSIITGNLKNLLVAEGGALTQKAGSAHKFEPLMTLTKDSGTANAAMAAFMMPADLARDMKIDGKERVMAAMVSGKFKSAFPGGRPAGGEQEGQQAAGAPHKAEADGEGTIVVIADVDMFADHNAVDKFRFGPQVMLRARNDNLNFLFNAADFLGGSEDLIAIRSKGRIARPFTRVAEIQKNAQKRWQSEEEQLTTQLNDLQKKLGEMQAQRTDGNRFVLTADQQAEIARFRDQERDVKRRRREVRKNLREDIERMGRQVVAANMLFVPLAATVIGVGVFFRRGRRHRKDRQGG